MPRPFRPWHPHRKKATPATQLLCSSRRYLLVPPDRIRPTAPRSIATILIEAVQTTIRRLHDSPRSSTSSSQFEPPFWLIGEILYGSGLRLLECLSVRVKDVDLERRQIMVRCGKGNHDRAALLPARAREDLRAQLHEVERQHRAELAAGRGEVDLPYALRAKMPNAVATLPWQSLFPASRPCANPATGRPILNPPHDSAVQEAVQDAARAAQLDKRATCHTLPATASPPTSSRRVICPPHRSRIAALGGDLSRLSIASNRPVPDAYLPIPPTERAEAEPTTGHRADDPCGAPRCASSTGPRPAPSASWRDFAPPGGPDKAKAWRKQGGSARRRCRSTGASSTASSPGRGRARLRPTPRNGPTWTSSAGPSRSTRARRTTSGRGCSIRASSAPFERAVAGAADGLQPL